MSNEPEKNLSIVLKYMFSNLVQLQDKTEWKKEVSPAVNKETPFYRWYIYKHGYSRELVHKIIEKFGLERGQKILDPFCGAGTTLLAGAEKGQDVVGYDIMSFPVFASNTKLLRPAIPSIEKYEQEFTISKIFSIKSPLSTDIKIFDKAFKKDTLDFLFKFRTKINEVDDSEIKAIFLLCFLKTLEQVGKAVKGGGFLRLKKYKRQVSNEKILDYFNSFLSEIKEDIATSEIIFSGKSKALIGDSRKIKSDEKFDAVISSPPYPNRHDYTRVYLLEEALGFNKDNAEIKELRYKTLRSHVEAKKQKFSTEGYSQPEELKKIITQLSSEKLNNPQITEMLEGFFEDMFITLKSIKSKMKKGGKIGFVISNARYSGIPILTDEILFKVGKQAGLTPLEILILRTRGNSSQQMKEYSREPARESLVIWSV